MEIQLLKTQQRTLLAKYRHDIKHEVTAEIHISN